MEDHATAEPRFGGRRQRRRSKRQQRCLLRGNGTWQQEQLVKVPSGILVVATISLWPKPKNSRIAHNNLGHCQADHVFCLQVDHAAEECCSDIYWTLLYHTVYSKEPKVQTKVVGQATRRVTKRRFPGSPRTLALSVKLPRTSLTRSSTVQASKAQGMHPDLYGKLRFLKAKSFSRPRVGRHVTRHPGFRLRVCQGFARSAHQGFQQRDHPVDDVPSV